MSLGIALSRHCRVRQQGPPRSARAAGRLDPPLPQGLPNTYIKGAGMQTLPKQTLQLASKFSYTQAKCNEATLSKDVLSYRHTSMCARHVSSCLVFLLKL